MRFCEAACGVPGIYEIRVCPLYGLGRATVTLVPRTTGLRPLSFDGGGVCGVAPLE